jgi:diacylglycerol kinase
MFVTFHRYTKRMLEMASVAVLIILLYIVMLFVSAIFPQ